jgi:hypothetical protein
MSSGLKDELFALKNRLEVIENQLTGQLKEIEARDEKWKRMEKKLEAIKNSQGDSVKLNIGGKVFSVSVGTIKKFPESLLCRLLDSGRVDLNEEIFFDRSPATFDFILEYVRNGQLNFNKFKEDQLSKIKDDAEYFGIFDLEMALDERLKDIEFLSYEYSGPYIYNGQTSGNGTVEDLKDKSCLKGICANTPGWIIIELNGIWDFDTLQVGGWKGNSSLWYPDNGAGASIQTSLDKQSWKTVGTIPSGYGTTIATVKLTKSSARYIKFTYTSYVGVGYLHIKKLESK